MKQKVKCTYYLRRISMSLILFTAMICVVVPSHAAGSRKKAIKAYKRMLSASQIRWSSYSNVPSADVRFALKDINRDGTPELVVYYMNASHFEGWNRVFTYYKSRVKSLGHLTDVTINPGKKCFVDTYSNTGSTQNACYTIKNGRRKDLVSYDTSDTKPSGNSSTKKIINGYTLYYYKMKVRGKSASYRTCMKKYKSLTKKAYTPDFYDNTYSNRIAHLK